MNNTQFRAVLDWRMCSDPFPQDVPMVIIDDWIERESQDRGYASFAVAYSEHPSRFANDGPLDSGTGLPS
jgi:hypothetical protein